MQTEPDFWHRKVIWRLFKFFPVNDHAERLEKLESHIAHLERQIDELNGVVIQQSQELDRLKKQLGRVSQSIENAELERIKSVNTKPPHYQ